MFKTFDAEKNPISSFYNIENVILLRLQIDSWCNGNTTVFGTVIQGSSPCESTESLHNLLIVKAFVV